MSSATSVSDWLESNWRLDLTLSEWWDLLFDAGYAFPTWPAASVAAAQHRGGRGDQQPRSLRPA